jgi:hypothetical protein
LAENLAQQVTQPDPKSDPIYGHETVSVAFKPLDIFHMGLISDAKV